jgi:protein involved in polysaccharide export with SLBB domain
LLLGFGEPGHLGLKEGDRIIVPAIGPTVAIFAAVSRPGIYELRGGSLSIRDGLMLAGGPLTAQGQRLLKLSVGPDGRETVTEQNASRGSLKRGDLLGVLPRSQGTAGAFYLSGHVYTEGWQSLNSTPGLRELLSNNSIMRNGPYLPFVVVKRFSPYNQSPEFIGVGGSLLLRSGADFPLQDQDQVIILSHDDIRYLSSEDVRLVMAGLAPIYGRTTPFKEALNERSFGQGGFRQGGQNNQTNQDNQSNQNNQNNQNGQTDQSGQNSLSQNGFRSRPDAIASMQVCEGLRSLASQVVERGMASHVDQPSSDGMLQNILPCPKLFDQYPSLLPFLIQNVMSLNGAVYRPGLYPVTDDGVLVDILSAAGGPLNTADPNKVEVTALRKGTAIRQQISLALAQTDYQIGPQSSVTVAEQFSNMDKGSVFLKGEVRYPGRYTLLRGERLSQVIERAGGFTEEAYVLGAVFQRQSIRDEEQKNYVRMARELEASMPNAFQKMAATSQGNIDGSLAVMQQAVHSLQSAVASGRMVSPPTSGAARRSPSSPRVA